MGNERHRNNFIKVDGFIEYGKKLIFIVIKFMLAIGKNICQRELLMWYYIVTSPYWWIGNSFSRLYYTKNQ